MSYSLSCFLRDIVKDTVLSIALVYIWGVGVG